MLKISQKFNPSTSQLDFFSEGSTGDPAVDNVKINLSRGGEKLYPLSRLQDHNGTGANWKDGAAIHTPERMKAYVARVHADIKKAIETGQKNGLYATDPTVLATVNGDNGGVLFAPTSGKVAN